MAAPSKPTAPTSHPCFARAWARLGSRVGTEEQRVALLRGLTGRVLEVGAGDGRNFGLYPATVVEVVAIEPEPYLRRRAIQAARATRPEVRVLDGHAEALPVDDHSCHAAVASLVLCSVDNQAAALAELKRVVVPGGELRFFEHVLAGRGLVNLAQRALDLSGLWPRLGGGCHLSRDTLTAISAEGFRIESVRGSGVGLGSCGVPFVLGRARTPSP